MDTWVISGLVVAVIGLLWLVRQRTRAWQAAIRGRQDDEVRLLALFEGSPLPTWVFASDSLRILEVNEAALRQYGYSREEFGDLTVRDLQIEDAWPVLDRQRSTHRRKNGTRVNVELHSRLVTFSGQPARLVIAEDITSRLGAEQALRESEAQFRAMADASPAGVVMMAPDGGVKYVNDTTLRMLGMPMMRALGEGWIAGLHPDDRERLQSQWTAAATACEPFMGAGRFLHVDGRVFWWRMQTSPVWADGVCLGHVGVIVDETEQRAAEDALRESEERFRQLAEHLPAVVYLVDPETRRMLFISPAYERIWGRPRASLYSDPRSFLDAVHPDDQERVTQAYRRGLSSLTLGYRIKRPDGELVWIEDMQFPIRHAEGGVYLLAGLAFDVTRRHRLEEQLIESQKMESLGRLAGGVAHDFNNLLTVILSYADLLKELAAGNQEMVSGLEEIETAGVRAASLTRALLTFARRQVIDPRELDVNDTVERLLPMVRHLAGERISVEVAAAATAATARLDSNQFDQVIMNLASNARDAMPSGGTLRIETRTVIGPVAGTDVPAGEFVVLRLSDTGTGIPAEIRAQVFDPFFTTKPKGQGTGLGLSTSYGIVTQFGGYMTLETRFGQGTTVSCYFPTVPPVAEHEVPAVVDSVSAAGRETILVVEDEPMVREVARATLERQGYRVVTAANGVEGLEVSGTLGDVIDLVVTDVVMPEMGGWEMAERLRGQRPSVKILFTSGYNEEIANAGGRIGAEINFLPKPYLPAVLTQRVRHALDV